MSAVLITGCSGAGKSTIAAVLARRGLTAIDADDAPALARFVLPGYQARLRASGAILIDARQPLGHVVDAILSHTLPAS